MQILLINNSLEDAVKMCCTAVNCSQSCSNKLASQRISGPRIVQDIHMHINHTIAPFHGTPPSDRRVPSSQCRCRSPALTPSSPLCPQLDSQYFRMMIFLHHRMAFDAFFVTHEPTCSGVKQIRDKVTSHTPLTQPPTPLTHPPD